MKERAAWIALSTAVAIVPVPVFADGCDAMAQKIIAQTGATLVRKSPEFGNVFMSHPSASGGFSVTCSEGKPSGLEIAYGEAVTPRFFGLASASVTAFLGGKDQSFVNAATTCLLSAKADPTGFASAETGKLAIDCTVEENGGDGSLSIRRRE